RRDHPSQSKRGAASTRLESCQPCFVPPPCSSTGIGRAGDGLVAALAQNGDGLRADQASAADSDDLHCEPPGSWARKRGCVTVVRRATISGCCPPRREYGERPSTA